VSAGALKVTVNSRRFHDLIARKQKRKFYEKEVAKRGLAFLHLSMFLWSIDD
jgi:hypothetical protein